jgi:hypothetical protein
MARKRAGDFLNILSDPEKSSGLLAGSTPIMLKAGTPAGKPASFPGVIGLGAVSGTGVSPQQRKAILDDDGDGGGGKFRMDLALAALLGLLVTNIVSFTLGARAGRQAVGPDAVTTAIAPEEVTNAAKLFTPGGQTAASTPQQPLTPPPTPASVEAPVQDTFPMMSGNTVTTPATPATTTRSQPTPAPAPAPAPEASMKGKYVVRLITLRYDAHRQALAQKIKAHMESNGFSPCIVRTSNGKLVIEVGAHAKYRQADALKAKVRKMKVGHERFDSAYVVQRGK